MIQTTLHQLKVFEAVARHGSFTRAAEELLITQPTVSSQVKHLSQAVGLPLFEQIGKQLYLTDAGQELQATCHDIFQRLEHFEMTIADLKGAKQGRLSLSVVTTAKYVIPRLLGSFCQNYPAIDIALQVINHQQITQRMLENKDDLYILSQPPEDIDLCTKPFLDNPLVVVAPSNHPLVGKTQIPIEALNNEPFIMRESGSGTRRAVQKLFDKSKVSVRVRLELGSNEAIKQAIAGGLGISVLSKHTLNSYGDQRELTTLDVVGFPIQRCWYAAYLNGKQLSVVAQTFLEYLLECGKSH
ncbi:LysR family transcriptional regulator [Arthrospira platensis FACHB-439]|uniref:LysR family transcriptional regulator n=1 Tax=Limnospira platensis NIES-46 TaxID=1236695 RepID=A0A5M3SYM6_LIMPL|nr:LysR family transcriptional regulator [Arthrospira platensis]AMW29554.1 LysR family transcriptional regulator [Arthrospira platensis YZ]MBD2669008.1 LysR family transcriptional regulator [Arthrospira platensis FACHB-439]MDF2212501.1 LysR substrate-binding domain-containing protein [Arthrospira platensis NCB002]MDT9294035.1 LysR substrate-binding domain-containing protein [Arthrospira platensis PCC 7345]QQW27470.1 LysR substrate-binding domain-containing protein [Arthrospira sp. PCC 9108]BA